MISTENARLRARLDEIEQQLRILEEERTHIQSDLASVVYPILSLPAEITSEIFVQCLDGRPIKAELTAIPLVLTRVCGAWRDLALNIPRLWGRLRLVFGEPYSAFNEPPPVYPQPSRALVDTWLARSGSAPLVMHVEHAFPAPEAGTSLPPLLHDIIRHSSSSRWKQMKFSVPFSLVITEFAARMDFPLLESLALSACDIRVQHPDAPILAFSDAPNLRSVCLDWTLTPWTIKLPWAQLTHFDADGYSPEACHKVLCLAPTLVKCSFWDVVESRLVSLPELHLKHLEDLTLSGSFPLLSHCLHLPKLHRINLDERGENETAISSNLLAFLSRASEITRLVCYPGSGQMNGILWQVSVLNALPKLTHLELVVSFEHSAAIISALLNSPSFLPRIQSIDLTIAYSMDGIYPVDYDVLADALAARWKPQPGFVRLERFALVWEPGTDCDTDRLSISAAVFDIGDRLPELKKKGMDIRILMDIDPAAPMNPTILL